MIHSVLPHHKLQAPLAGEHRWGMEPRLAEHADPTKNRLKAIRAEHEETRSELKHERRQRFIYLLHDHADQNQHNIEQSPDSEEIPKATKQKKKKRPNTMAANWHGSPQQKKLATFQNKNDADAQ